MSLLTKQAICPMPFVLPSCDQGPVVQLSVQPILVDGVPFGNQVILPGTTGTIVLTTIDVQTMPALIVLPPAGSFLFEILQSGLYKLEAQFVVEGTNFSGSFIRMRFSIFVNGSSVSTVQKDSYHSGELNTLVNETFVQLRKGDQIRLVAGTAPGITSGNIIVQNQFSEGTENHLSATWIRK